ncbi:DUF308 domain-containing protein [Isoptericola sp. AK164]|uniref:HdeD family acid-resistance protein n=1 Tax=Isoptericola sp. AK164 TaxID=3024246 RepID=UPI0024186B42|nr:DUF308 domain-containing protein [Isoptericola sp. AK164]
MARDDGTTQDEATAEAPGAARNPFRRVWWLPVLRGISYIVLGLLLMIEPLEELEILRLLIGIFLAFDGVLVLVQWLVHRRQVGSAWWLAQAGVNLGFGAAVALWPELSPTPLYYVLAVWTIVLGIVAIIGGAALSRNRDLGWPWMVAFGITAALFGLLLVTRPLDSFDVLRLVTIVFALFAFVAGSLNIVSGFAVRSVSRELQGLREQAERVGVVVTGGSVLGAANPQAAPARAAGPRPAPGGQEVGATSAGDAPGTPSTPRDEAASPTAAPDGGTGAPAAEGTGTPSEGGTPPAPDAPSGPDGPSGEDSPATGTPADGEDPGAGSPGGTTGRWRRRP